MDAVISASVDDAFAVRRDQPLPLCIFRSDTGWHWNVC
jgi:hypothetical protein